MRKIVLGELTAHIAGGSDGNGAGSGPIVVLLHGFGAPGTDLVGLASETPAAADTRYVFPMAPLELESGPSTAVGRAWWMIDMAALQVAVMTRSYETLVRHEPPGLADARRALESLLDGLEAELRPPAPIFLGGFSQGAMLATDVVLRSERAFSGLIVLSGMPIAEAEWTPRLDRRRGLPVFQSHGRADPILPYPAAELLRDRLAGAGLELDFHSFAGGHGIPRDVLQKLGEFVRRHEGRNP